MMEGSSPQKVAFTIIHNYRDKQKLKRKLSTCEPAKAVRRARKLTLNLEDIKDDELFQEPDPSATTLTMRAQGIE